MCGEKYWKLYTVLSYCGVVYRLYMLYFKMSLCIAVSCLVCVVDSCLVCIVVSFLCIVVVVLCVLLLVSCVLL